MRSYFHKGGWWLVGLAIATLVGVHVVKGQEPARPWYDWALGVAILIGLVIAIVTTDTVWNGLRPRLRVVREFLPSVQPPKRRLGFPRRYDYDHARALIAAGRMGERLEQVFDVDEPEITSRSVGYRLRGKRQLDVPPKLAKAAANVTHSALAGAAAQESPSRLDLDLLRLIGDAKYIRNEIAAVTKLGGVMGSNHPDLTDEHVRSFIAAIRAWVDQVSSLLIAQAPDQAGRFLSATPEPERGPVRSSTIDRWSLELDLRLAALEAILEEVRPAADAAAEGES